MAIVDENDKKTGESESEESEAASEQEETVALEPSIEPTPIVETRPDEDGPIPTAPIQLGYRRYVYST